jgi:aldehyde:ferredoxin oxidoreductase
MASKKEGKLGRLLALGPKTAADRIGGDAPKFAIHVKGTGMNLHDWRAAWGVMLGQIVGGGASWPAHGANVYSPEPDVGYEKFTDPLDPKVQADAVAKTWPKKYWDDTHGTCWFATWGVPGSLPYSAEAVSAVTGWDFTAEEALMVGMRLVNLERAVNVRLGLKPKDDYEVSPRIIEAPPGGVAKGKAMAPYVKDMIAEVYGLMDWDKTTGMPSRDTLKKLHLEYVLDNINS